MDRPPPFTPEENPPPPSTFFKAYLDRIKYTNELLRGEIRLALPSAVGRTFVAMHNANMIIVTGYLDIELPKTLSPNMRVDQTWERFISQLDFILDIIEARRELDPSHFIEPEAT